MGSKEVVVIMVPFPLHGHLNQLLHLSRLISAHKLTVHYVGTTTHNRQVRRRFDPQFPISHNNNNNNNNNIIFHDFHSLPYQSPPPDPNAPIKFPSHLQPLIDAATLHLRRPVSELMRDISATSRRVVIIYDSLMGSVVQDFVSLSNAEIYTFHSVSAFSMILFLWEKMGIRPFCMDDEEMVKNVPSLQGCFTPEFLKFIENQHQYTNLNSGRIYNTSRVIESPFLELLAKQEISRSKPQWALGPFNPVKIKTAAALQPLSQKYLSWLDRQPRNSVVLVSFGTTTSLSDEQIKEVAIGLEKSEQRFIWVLRDADRGDDFQVKRADDQLFIKCFENNNGTMGIIVRDWAPQLEILGHHATGGFMSHCGWNSCMESISMGVPIAAWPMHSDQPRNAVLITDVLKIGIVVRDWERRNEVVRSSTVESVVRRLMASEEMRDRAAELRNAVKNGVAEGGVTHVEFDSFISHITRS